MVYQIDTADVVNEYTDFILDTDIMFMSIDCKFIWRILLPSYTRWCRKSFLKHTDMIILVIWSNDIILGKVLRCIYIKRNMPIKKITVLRLTYIERKKKNNK